MKKSSPVKFLKHVDTGQVMVKTRILSKHPKMRPYEFPVEGTPATEKVVVEESEMALNPDVIDSVIVQDDQVMVSDAPIEVPRDQPDTIMNKQDAADLVKKLFGRDHSRVTIADLTEYGKTELGVELVPAKKLAMVAEIAAILQDKE